MSANLFDALMSGKDLRSPALHWDGRTSTYGELFDRTGRLANRVAELGVKRGDRVAVQVEKSETALLLYLASLRVGSIYLPFNTGYTAAELGYFLKDAEPALVVVDPAQRRRIAPIADAIGATLATLDATGRAGTLLEQIDTQAMAFETAVAAPQDLAAILYTSGTTGRSKGAMLSHENLRSNAAALVDAWRFTPADVLLNALPIYHTHGLFVATNVLLMAGGSIHLLPKFDLDAIFAALPPATTMMGVPTFYTRLLGDPRLNAETTGHIRLFVSGSAPLLAETHNAWRETTGHMILERYGMTETNMNTSNPYDGERRPGTVGPPLAGVEVRIVDPASAVPLAVGEIGMIEVRGPNVFQGYWRMPEKTAAELRTDGWFITGDLGQISKDGYVEIVGRGKDLIISGGLNVYPKEVEGEIDAIEGVGESAVVGLPDADFGEAVAAAIVLEPGAMVDARAVQAYLSDRLARFKCPKHIVFVPALPRNAMGKVQKSELRSTLAATVHASLENDA